MLIHVNLIVPLYRSLRAEAGFTLVEVLIALFVFSISALAIAAMTFMSIQGNAMTNQMSQATFLAQDKMEELLAIREYPSGSPQKNLVSTLSDLSDPGIPTHFSRTWQAVSCDDLPTPTPADLPMNASFCLLQVNVDWTDNKGTHHVEVESLWRRL